MLSVELPESLEKNVKTMVQNQFHGNWQEAMTAFLRLHEKYGWKDQFAEDITTIRKEVRKQGGITEKAIDEAIVKYRKQSRSSRAE